MIALKSNREIGKMRAAGKLTAQALHLARRMAKPGKRVLDIDRSVGRFIWNHGGKPIFKGYRIAPGVPPFPGNICASFNEEVVHGIPSVRKLQKGDILSIDCGVKLEGYCADAAITVAVEPVTIEARRLMNVTREALALGIGTIRCGIPWYQVAASMQMHVEAAGFSMVTKYGSHGIGSRLHEEPANVPNYVLPIHHLILTKGMTIAIEPMVTERPVTLRTKPDRWTIETTDGTRSAHWEHTVAVTETGAEVLTKE